MVTYPTRTIFTVIGLELVWSCPLVIFGDKGNCLLKRLFSINLASISADSDASFIFETLLLPFLIALPFA